MPSTPKKIRKASLPKIISGVVILAFLASCTEFEKPQTSPFFAETAPPPKQEFRWSNGRMPKSFDPARASTPPETDIARSIYEGLTEIDAKTLEAKPGVAETWTASDDQKTWTFVLRNDAKWSNGKPVTAQDFVRSWQRLADLGEAAAHRNLLDNIARSAGPEPSEAPSGAEDFLESEIDPVNLSHQTEPPASNSAPSNSNSIANTQTPALPDQPAKPKVVRLDVAAEGAHILKIRLIGPDKDFAKLVANPIFRPVFGAGDQFADGKLDPGIVTNGAFKIAVVEPAGISLQRSETYWSRESVELERVQFVPATKPDDALEAYRTGKVDAITNADFAPLAQKMLSPYNDFRKSAFAALNFYEINHKRPPFNDRRIRQALAIAIERERLTDGELAGTTQPALSFLPFATSSQTKLVQDKERARELFEEAGFPGGAHFPVIRLVINRNETQQRVARTIARMWKETLGVETEIVVKETSEIADVRAALDFDVIRRGVVLPTPDETVSMMAIFGLKPAAEYDETGSVLSETNSNSNVQPRYQVPPSNSNSNNVTETIAETMVVTEEDALYELHAIPLYFPTSFALVKPYVSGFEMNSLDAPLLQDVSIDHGWKTKRQ